MDADGNLYGTTANGGTDNYGTVFKLDASNNYALSTLVSFNGTNGRTPCAGVIMDGAGNLYGTTENGGTGSWGTVFKLDASNSYALSTLANFSWKGPYGDQPTAGLAIDSTGNLYGLTTSPSTAFKLDASNNYSISPIAAIGYYEDGTLAMDRAGNLYGVSREGGANGLGAVFKLNASSGYSMSTLVNFTGTNGQYPWGSLAIDSAGNLYGTTDNFSTPETVFKLDASNGYALSTLATGTALKGLYACAPTMDAAGSLYVAAGIFGGAGTILKFDAANGYAPSSVANLPNAPDTLIIDAAGDIFGTTFYGGDNNDGTVFELAPTPEPATLSLLVLGGLAMLRRRK
jgi:uncharacterized repeat protein (TIGR03803 family)